MREKSSMRDRGEDCKGERERKKNEREGERERMMNEARVDPTGDP